MGGPSKFNLLYLFVWFPTVIALILGRLFHSIFGQGGQIRDEELVVEHAARVQWIYPLDGVLFGSLLLNASKILYYAIIPGSSNEYTKTLTGMAVFLVYMAGNVVFINAMQIQWSLGVKMVIIGTLAFALAMLIAFIFELEEDIEARKAIGFFNVIQYILRFLFIVFALAAWWIYRGLWSAYTKDRSRSGLTGFECTFDALCSRKVWASSFDSAGFTPHVPCSHLVWLCRRPRRFSWEPSFFLSWQ
jgi:hypothetical protein